MRPARTPEHEAEIERFACSTDPHERRMAAHLATPEALARLAGDDDLMVRLYVGINPETPEETRQTLEADTHPVVAELARRARIRVISEEPKDLTAFPVLFRAKELARVAREYSLPLEPTDGPSPSA